MSFIFVRLHNVFFFDSKFYKLLICIHSFVLVKVEKSLSCKSTFNNDVELKQRYEYLHNLLQKLFSNKQNYFSPKKCLNCDEFLTTAKSKRIHDLFKHYTDRKNHVFENKPIEVNYSGNIKTNKISISRHSNHHCFQNVNHLLLICCTMLEVNLNLVVKS